MGLPSYQAIPDLNDGGRSPVRSRKRHWRNR